MERKKFAIWGLIILALAAGGIFWLTRRGTETAPEPLEQTQQEESASTTQETQEADTEGQTETEVVTYTSSGYSPATITVQRGTTVSFVNNSNGSMWTASDPHPTHTSYGEFDARQGMGRGQSYNFTFSEPGTFTYHNHLNTTHRGTVIVE